MQEGMEGMEGRLRVPWAPPPAHHLYLCSPFCLLADSSRQLGIHLGRQSEGELLRRGILGPMLERGTQTGDIWHLPGHQEPVQAPGTPLTPSFPPTHVMSEKTRP